MNTLTRRPRLPGRFYGYRAAHLRLNPQTDKTEKGFLHEQHGLQITPRNADMKQQCVSIT